MSDSPDRAPGAGLPRILPLAYTAAFATSYFLGFVWFHLARVYHTEAGWNLLVNAGFGFFYVVGCAGVMWLTRRVSPRRMLLWAYWIMIGLSLAASLGDSRWSIAAAIFGFSLVLTATWPNLEALAAVGREGAELGRAVSNYNISWALMSAVSYPIAGKLYGWSATTLFFVPAAIYGGAVILTMRRVPASGLTLDGHAHAEKTPPEFSPAFIKSMKDISLLGNLGCYLLINVLVPIFPYITRDMGLVKTWQAALFGAIWMAGRVSAFLILGRWHGWHFRRRMFFCVMFMLPALFAVVTLSGSLVLAGVSEYLLGLGLGFIYTSSLFYSLQGEFNAGDATIHEAALGVGMMLGPLLSAGAATAARARGVNPIHATAAVNIALILGVTAFMLFKARGAAATRPARASAQVS